MSLVNTQFPFQRACKYSHNKAWLLVANQISFSPTKFPSRGSPGQSSRKWSGMSPLDLTQPMFKNRVPLKASTRNFSTLQLKKNNNKKQTKSSFPKPSSFRHESKNSSGSLKNNDAWILLSPYGAKQLVASGNQTLFTF